MLLWRRRRGDCEVDWWDPFQSRRGEAGPVHTRCFVPKEARTPSPCSAPTAPRTRHPRRRQPHRLLHRWWWQVSRAASGGGPGAGEEEQRRRGTSCLSYSVALRRSPGAPALTSTSGSAWSCSRAPGALASPMLPWGTFSPRDPGTHRSEAISASRYPTASSRLLMKKIGKVASINRPILARIQKWQRSHSLIGVE